MSRKVARLEQTLTNVGEAFTQSQPNMSAKFRSDSMNLVGEIKRRGQALGTSAKNKILDLAYPPINGLRNTMTIFKARAVDIYTAVLGVAQVLVIMQIGSSV